MNRVLVLGWGNPSRGDDALGPRLLERLEGEAAARPEWRAHGFVTDFQLAPEHALDFEGVQQVLFVDASSLAQAPFAFTRVEASHDRSFTTHALSPQALLAVRADLGGTVPPAWQLAVRGLRFGLGDPMTDAASAHLEAAVRFAAGLLSNADPAAWDGLATPAVACTN